MAATAINSRSNELAQILAPLYGPLKPNQQHGRVRLAVFTKTFAAEAAGEDVALCVLPKGARILGGEFIFSATLGGTATISFGLMDKAGSGFIDTLLSVSDNVALLFAATALTATAKQVLAATVALSYQYETEKELYVTCTTAAAAMGTQVLTGHILYAVD